MAVTAGRGQIFKKPVDLTAAISRALVGLLAPRSVGTGKRRARNGCWESKVISIGRILRVAFRLLQATALRRIAMTTSAGFQPCAAAPVTLLVRCCHL